ncbi:MAG: Hsp20/alpha crystallin family protein [Halanaeroarchaeum sp.]
MGRRNPFDEIERMLDRMAKQFEGMDDIRSFDAGFASRIDVDVEDRPDDYVVTADLPGFEKEDIDVELADETLRISAQRASEHEDEEPGRYVRRERSRESMSRSISLPEPVREDDVEGRFKNGVLTVTLPKRHTAEDSHSIDIE